MTIEFTVDHNDTIADDNGITQLIGPVTATVETRPGNYRVRNLGGGTPSALKLAPRKGYLAANGHMYADETMAAPFRLVANDPAFNLRELTYRFDFDLTTLAGIPVSIPFCRGPAPSTDTTLYLARLMNDLDQMVIEVRTKGYAQDILDASPVGIDLVTAVDGPSAMDGLIPGTYQADAHGLKGDWTGGDAISGSGTNDTAALTALIALVPAGSIIMFNTLKTYRLDPMVITKSLVLDFQGGNVVTHTCHATNPALAETLFYFQSPTGTARAMNTSARGDTSVTVTTAGQAADFAVDDYVVLEDRYQTEDWDNPGSFTNTLGRAEMNRVSSVDTGTGVVTLASPTVHDYLTSPRTITKVTPLVRPEVRNVGLLIDTDPGHTMTALVETPHAPHIMFFDACLEPRVSNVTVENWVGQIAVFNRCQRYHVADLTGRDPFYTDAGLGYVMRSRHSNDGLAERVVGIHNRHTVDYHGAVRCVSRNCRTYNHTNVAYMTHGLDSRDIVSEDDSVVSNEIGWAHGNPQFNADYGFTIIRPRYNGTNIAIVADSLSEGTTIISPMLRTSVRAISIRGGAKYTTIDLTGGEIEIRGTDVNAWAIKGEVYPAATPQPTDVHIKGGGRLTGSRALISMNVQGNVTLDGVDPSLVDLQAGNLISADSMFIPGQTSTVTAAGTTTLGITSSQVQEFTGTTTQTVVLPVTSVQKGASYTIINNSTGTVTVQSSAGETIFAQSPNRVCVYTARFDAPNHDYSWQITGMFTTTAATANSVAQRDTSANLSADAFIPGQTSTATAAGTTTLTIDSTQLQVFTGTATQTVKLPSTSIAAGMSYTIVNNSTGTVTVQASDGSTIFAQSSNRVCVYTARLDAPATSTSWQITGMHTASTATANSVAQRDTSANLTADCFVATKTSTATAAGTTTLTNDSSQVQVFTGSTTQTVKLPTTAIIAGQQYTIINQSTADVTVQSSAANTIATLTGAANPSTKVFIALQDTPTADTHWRAI